MERNLRFAVYVVTKEVRKFDWEASLCFTKRINAFGDKKDAIKYAENLLAKDIKEEEKNKVEYCEYRKKYPDTGKTVIAYETYEHSYPRDVAYIIDQLWIPLTLSGEESDVMHDILKVAEAFMIKDEEENML